MKAETQEDMRADLWGISGTHGRCSSPRSSRCQCSRTHICPGRISRTRPSADRANNSRGCLRKKGDDKKHVLTPPFPLMITQEEETAIQSTRTREKIHIKSSVLRRFPIKWLNCSKTFKKGNKQEHSWLCWAENQRWIFWMCNHFCLEQKVLYLCVTT